MNEKIDFVITWVDGSDPKWLNEKNKYLKIFLKNNPLVQKIHYSAHRYRDWETLKYWFRGVEKYAPWVHKIYFVTCGQKPAWLNEENEKLVLINHKDFIPEKYLPTFNSEAIEVNLHRIKGLEENFVYFNDDLFLIKPTKKEDFFKNGLPCDTAVLGIVPMQDDGYTAFNNACILNKYFHKNEVLRKYWKKWYNINYGAAIIKTFLLTPWKKFTGMTEYHLCNSLKKATFLKLWNLEPEVFEITSSNKFRGNNDVNLWLLKNYQILSGAFTPRNPKIGKSICQNIDKNVTDLIIKQKYKILCINDKDDLTEKEFLRQKKLLKDAFEKILPDKSSFEK